MLSKQNRSFDIEKLLTNRRGKISAANILKLLVVFSIAIFFQCSTLLFTKEFIIFNNVSSTTFVFIAFALTAIISIIRQSSWKYVFYLNAKRIPIIIAQSILYSISFLCLIYGITTTGIIEYYSVINIILILNVFSNLNALFSSLHSKVSRFQLCLSCMCVILGMYLFCNGHISQIIGLISLSLYHL